jgi:hypothetical protein
LHKNRGASVERRCWFRTGKSEPVSQPAFQAIIQFLSRSATFTPFQVLLANSRQHTTVNDKFGTILAQRVYDLNCCGWRSMLPEAMNRTPKACYQPTRLIDLDLPSEIWAVLKTIAARKGISLEAGYLHGDRSGNPARIQLE